MKVAADLHFPTVYLHCTAKMQQTHYANRKINNKCQCAKRERVKLRLALSKIAITINLNCRSTMLAKKWFEI